MRAMSFRPVTPERCVGGTSGRLVGVNATSEDAVALEDPPDREAPESSTIFSSTSMRANVADSGKTERRRLVDGETRHIDLVPEESALLAWRARGENVHERDVVPLREHRRRRNHQRWRAGGNQAALQVDLVVDVLLRETWDQKGRRTAQMKAHTGGDESRAWAEPLAPSLRL